MNGMIPGQGMDMGMGAVGGGGAAAHGGKDKDKVAKAKAASSNKFKRVAGGKSWEDETLADWPESEKANKRLRREREKSRKTREHGHEA